MKKIRPIIEIIRPYQWYKNLIVFIGIIFSGYLFQLDILVRVISAFILLCAVSGVNYIINDIIDIENDKRHPEKRKRALPSGEISKKDSTIFAIILLLFSVYFSFSLSYLFGLGIILFIFLGVAYSLFLKNIFIVDIITIGISLTLRAILGVIIIDAYISPWLVLCTFLLALFLALGKRKGELNLMGKNAIKHKKVFNYYNNQLLDLLITSTLTTLLISYFIYCIFHATHMFIITTIPVAAYLLFRYLSLILSKNFISERPEKIIKNKDMIIGVVIWIVLIMVSLYVF
jgi:4-hydroxybenzoate polyprenyltransferase